MSDSFTVYVRPHMLTDKSLVHNVVMVSNDDGKELFSLPAYDYISAQALADGLVTLIALQSVADIHRRS